MNKLQEIREALEAATPGPWNEYEKESVKQDNGCYRSIASGNGYLNTAEKGFEIDGFISPQDANLIAHTPEYLSYLLQLVETHRAAFEAIGEELTDCTDERAQWINKLIAGALGTL